VKKLRGVAEILVNHMSFLAGLSSQINDAETRFSWKLEELAKQHKKNIDKHTEAWSIAEDTRRENWEKVCRVVVCRCVERTLLDAWRGMIFQSGFVRALRPHHEIIARLPAVVANRTK
jgi:hypothetical protein